MSVSQADMQKLSLTFALASDMLRDAVTEGLKSRLGEEQAGWDTMDRYWEAIDWDYRLHNSDREYTRLAPGALLQGE